MKTQKLFLFSMVILTACAPSISATRDLPYPVSATTISTAFAPSSQILAFTPTAMPTSRIKNGCISPLVVARYPLGEVSITPSPKPKIPPAGWDLISSIPDELRGIRDSGLFLVRPQLGYDELWAYINNNPDSGGDSSYLIYRTDTKQWRQAPVPPGGRLFLDANHNVWATAVSKNKSEPVLYRVDERTNLFVPVMDKENELNNGIIYADVEIDVNGLFWFTFRRDKEINTSLFSFNPVTLESKSYLTENFSSSIAIDKNGNVYLIQVKDEPFVSHNYNSPFVLIKYNPLTGDTSSIEIIRTSEEFGDGNRLFIDRQNWLWVSDIVWIDITESGFGKQFAIIRSPIFIDYDDFQHSYVWMRPLVVLQSVDGRLWYRSTRGNAWLKPDTGEWCLFTTYSSNLVEDSNHNLWMMADGKLYELKITP